MRPGQNAFSASRSMTIESLPPENSSPGCSNSAATSRKIWIDSAFIGSCTNGRIEDLRQAAAILKGRTVARGLVLKIVPATDRVWKQCLEEGLIDIFKKSGALVSNAGCAGCAAGQVGQNGPGEVSISTGNRNFPGKQGKGEVYLASPGVVAATAIAGYITEPESIPETPELRPFVQQSNKKNGVRKGESDVQERPKEVRGRVWYIPRDNIDTDMIYHNRYLQITEIDEMGQYTFDNLEGYEDLAGRIKPGDIVLAGKNFGSGSSRQQAVDCFASLGVQCLVAESFGSIYERNAINAAFPILSSSRISELNVEDGDEFYVNFSTGEIRNNTRDISVTSAPFSDVQMEIFQKNGLF